MVKRLKKTLKQFPGKNVIVWGDIILDEYIFTSTRRISREAPVLVTEFESNEYKLGGAGNVVMNLKSLGANPVPLCFLGKDTDADVLKTLLAKNHIKTEFLIELEEYRTPKKSRILSGGENTKKQQILRIDTFNKKFIASSKYKLIEKHLINLLEDIDLLIISDYLYKSVQPKIFNLIRKQFPSRIIIIDSRNHLLNFKQTTIATPNEPELKKMFPDVNFEEEEDYYQAGKNLQARLQARGLLLKRGHKGMITFESNKKTQIIDIYGGTEIVDGTGAGDTVIAVTSLAYLTGADLATSAQLASIASGMVVMKEGAYPISFNELFSLLN
ncbi:MAG: bifunctional hydroxymethylpyrimidine kinase/phosphomethylpyrimidine kinase [Candidatus Aminicenantes bacterium]|nr:bifunctional hydroxymethylpyrimidine kinase/phosphomethylpyrimidine kinase [Candidatus Aminicenantes bacterium]